MQHERNKTLGRQPGTKAEVFMLHILYFVHDLADPAVRRRVLMLQAGGARGDVGGDFAAMTTRWPPFTVWNRSSSAGRVTRSSRSVSLLLPSPLCNCAGLLRAVEKPDVIIGRNLEMLAVANRAKSIFGGDMPVVYECLDIHRLLLRKDVFGGALRGVERHFGADAALLLDQFACLRRTLFPLPFRPRSADRPS